MTKPHKAPANPTLHNIAEALGISRTTVSEILSGSDRYSDAKRAQVLDMAATMNYRPNRSAQIVRKGRSNLIGVVHHGGQLQVAHERAYYLGHYISQTGYDLLLADVTWYQKNPVSMVNYMIDSRVEGIVFSGPSAIDSPENMQLLDRMEKANIPVVFISSESVKGIPTINADFADGFYQLTKHLISNGRRRLTLLLSGHPESAWHGVHRWKGFTKAIEEAGGEVRPPMAVNEYLKAWTGDSLQGEVVYSTADIGSRFSPFDSPQYIMEQLLDRGFSSDALVASNDDWAASAISVCIRRGIDVPGELAVTGFDNSNIAKLSPVQITTASQQSDDACRLGIDLLVKRMNGAKETTASILIPCPIIIRESSGGNLKSRARHSTKKHLRSAQ